MGRVQDRAASLAGVLALEARDADDRTYTAAALTMARVAWMVWDAAEQIATAARVEVLIAILESGVANG